ncbi:TPR end-of-group domain-containing protein [Oceanobacter mangrovi]|uniref:TPR end-of-group domain-containing protein n=1 Tax=Oceanobacter mangrovi TaxID=2862510 RepID=UPI001C8DD4A4|nr:hypothetical protein [Oceanobacter mangrovi]
MATAANRVKPSRRARLGSVLVAVSLWLMATLAVAADSSDRAADDQASADAKAEQTITHLQEPLYTAFTERYILDEVKNLRQMLADTRVELTEKIVDREVRVSDRALSYATDTVTYFFYLIAGASTLLVLVGWNSLRDIKERVGAYANDEIKRITDSYEARLDKLERELQSKSRHIAAAQEEIELTNEIHSLWLKASQENSPQSKIAIYDQILALRPDDVEALTYKADAALLLGQAQWACSLANRALDIDPDNSHALYQRACAHAESGFVDEALRDLEEAIARSETLRLQASEDPSFRALEHNELFNSLVTQNVR